MLERKGGGFMKRQPENAAQKELRHLKRQELLELLLEQTRRANQLEQRVNELEKQLENRNITLQKAGSLAEAALRLNEVFEAADAAARQYVMNVRRLVDLEIKQHGNKK